MAFNTHLLQLDIPVKKYKRLMKQRFSVSPEGSLNWLPDYAIARCPFCLSKNVEKINTYSLLGWSIRYGKAVYSQRLAGTHCNHFALVQSFFHFHNIWPKEASGQFCSEVPHIIGHLLENHQCQAVIHALPICRIESDEFVPRYTLFIISYFSEQPQKAYDSVIAFNAKYVEPGVAWPFIAPPEGYEHWWNLDYWVQKEQLFWVDANDPELGIRTGDTTSFPYGNIEGRTWPYLHTFPYPLPKPKKKKSS
ncbi:MAG: hypothetical protein IT327_09875 [Anaerolineae bacterium]|nr:hypothetical protein [Anaerolineae bacterium]